MNGKYTDELGEVAGMESGRRSIRLCKKCMNVKLRESERIYCKVGKLGVKYSHVQGWALDIIKGRRKIIMNSTIHPQAKQAIFAAKSINSWGRFAARKYAEKRKITRLYFLARQLEAMQKAGF